MKVLSKVLMLGAIAALAAGVLAYAKREYLTSWLKTQVESALSHELRAQVEIGRLQLDPGFAFGVRLRDVATGVQQDTCLVPLALEELRVRFRLLPLLRGTFQIKRLEARGITLPVELHSSPFRIRMATATHCQPTAREPTSRPVEFPNIKSLALEELTLDVRGEKSFQLRGMSIRTGLEAKGEHVRLIEPQIVFPRPGGDFNVSGNEVWLHLKGIRGRLSNLRIEWPGGVLAASSEWSEGTVSAELRPAGLPLSVVSWLISAYFGGDPMELPDVTGAVSGALRLRVSESERAVQGSMTVRGFSDSRLAAAFDLLALDELDLRADGSGIQGSVRLNLENFDLDTGGEQYAAASARGTVHFAPATGDRYHGKGAVDVMGFSFRDEHTAVTEVDATLRDVRFQVDERGAVEVRLQLDGSSVRVDHEQITVAGAESVSTPLRVTVSEQGEYSVRGPVRVDGGRLTTAGIPFDSVSGVVDLFVSGPRKEFTGRDIDFLARAVRGRVGATFRMTEDRYALEGATLELGQGSVEATGSLARTPPRVYELHLKADRVDISELGRLVAPQTTEIEGILRKFVADVRGQFPDPLAQLQGEGKFEFSRGRLPGFSFPRALRRALQELPLVGDVLIPRGEERSPSQRISSRFRIREQAVWFSRVRVEREQYTFSGSGSIKFDGTVDFQGAVIFLKETAQALGLGIDEIGSLFGRVAELEIPVTVSGTLPDFEVTVNKRRLLRDKSGLSFLERTWKSISKAFGGGRDGSLEK